MTTSRFRDFGSGDIIDTSAYEEITFALDGETFTCYPVIPGAALLDFVAEADSGETGRATGSILKFLGACMTEEEYERFTRFVKRPDRVTPMETLAAISTWLVEVYSARPTPLPSASPSGTGTTPPSSEAPSSSEASALTV